MQNVMNTLYAGNIQMRFKRLVVEITTVTGNFVKEKI